jgi:hypothetical protein
VLLATPDVASQIKAGHLSVNGFEIAPSVPFGGRKASGLGREGGPEGLEAFLENQGGFYAASCLEDVLAISFGSESRLGGKVVIEAPVSEARGPHQIGHADPVEAMLPKQDPMRSFVIIKDSSSGKRESCCSGGKRQGQLRNTGNHHKL